MSRYFVYWLSYWLQDTPCVNWLCPCHFMFLSTEKGDHDKGKMAHRVKKSDEKEAGLSWSLKAGEDPLSIHNLKLRIVTPWKDEKNKPLKTESEPDPILNPNIDLFLVNYKNNINFWANLFAFVVKKKNYCKNDH